MQFSEYAEDISVGEAPFFNENHNISYFSFRDGILKPGYKKSNTEVTRDRRTKIVSNTTKY